MKKSDKLIITVVIFLFSFALLCYLLDNLIALPLSITISILFLLSVNLIKPKNNITVDEFAKRILLLGKEESDKLIEKLNPTALKKDFGYISDDLIILNKVKYSPLSEEDVASAYRIAIKEGASEVLLYCLRVDKKALFLINELLIKIKPISIKKMYSSLKKISALPDKPPKIKRKGIKGLIVGLCYIPSKHFLLISVVLSLMSLVSPIKLYYLIFAFIDALIGLVIEIIKRKALDT